MNGDEGDAIVSLDRMLPTSKDGIQVDKMRQIVYNIPQQADAMFTGPISSPSQDRYHLPPLMVSSGITFSLASSHWALSGTCPCFMGWVGMRGNALVGYAQYERWDGSYVIRFC